ncbi:MAG: ATP-dependent helicase, partial [Pseudomonadota bacterium]
GHARAAAILASLDDEQRQAARSTEGPVLLLGGPGTGKKRVLSHHVAFLCAATTVPSRRVLVLAQTDDAAERIRARAELLLGRPLYGAWSDTFYGASQRILRAHASAIGRRPSFSILDSTEAEALVRRAARRVGMDLAQYPPGRLREAIARCKSQVSAPDAAIAEVFEMYERALAEANALDPDDVLLRAVQLLASEDAHRDRYRRRFVHVVVERLEDATRPQLELLELVAGPHGNVLAAADDDQTVVSRASSGIQPIDSFLEYYPTAKRLCLVNCYRCSKRIVQSATRLIAQNGERHLRRLVSVRRCGARVLSVLVGDESEEAALVVRCIRRLLSHQSAALRPADFAIVFRHDVQARPFEEALAKAGLPYYVSSGQRFWERREIRDLMSYLRLTIGGGDARSLARIANIPRRGIGPASVAVIGRLQKRYRISMAEAALRAAQLPRVTAERAGALCDLGRLLLDLDEAARVSSIVELIDSIVERTGYGRMLTRLSSTEEEVRRIGIDELRGVARAFPGSAKGSLSRLFAHVETTGCTPWASGSTGEDDGRAEICAGRAGHASGVGLLTFERVKGRQFRFVVMAGMEEGLLPHAHALAANDRAAIEAERRLCYTVMTRARDRLVMTRAAVRTMAGTTRARSPSQFLAEMGQSVRRLRKSGVARVGARRCPDSERECLVRSESVDSRGSTEDPELRPSLPSPSLPSAEAAARLASPEAELPATVLLVVHEGQTVLHRSYGRGVVVEAPSRDDRTPNAVATVRFASVGEKRLVVALAKLHPG